MDKNLGKKAEYLSRNIKSQQFDKQIEETLVALEDEQDREYIRQWLYTKVDEFLNRCNMVDQEELKTMLMWFYIQLKSEWSQINTEIQYQPMYSDEPDMVLIFKSSVLSQLIASVEKVMKYVDVERAVNFLAEPSWKLENLDHFKVTNEQQHDLMLRSEALQSLLIKGLNKVETVAQDLEAKLSDAPAQLNLKKSVQSNFEQLKSNFVQLTHGSNELRLGIIELKQTKAVELHRRLDRFFQEAQQRYGVWGQFSLTGAQMLMERKSIDLLIEPLTQILQLIMGVASTFEDSLELDLHVTYTGRRLKVALEFSSENEHLLHEVKQVQYGLRYQEVKEAIEHLDGQFFTESVNNQTVSFTVLGNERSNVMEEAVLFESAGVRGAIPVKFVTQMVAMDKKAIKKVVTDQTLVVRGTIHEYLGLSGVLNHTLAGDESVAILLKEGNRNLALGVNEVIGIETISLQEYATSDAVSPLVESIGITSDGMLVNFFELETLFQAEEEVI